MRGAVFVEERSAKVLIEAVAANLGLAERVAIIAHDGKKDLEISFARKIQAWRFPTDARFLISRDNDGSNCIDLKSHLASLVPPELLPRIKIRLIMQELEAWYLGDFRAVAAAGLMGVEPAASMDRQRKFADPDRLTNAANLFERVCSERGKIGWARSIGPHLNPARNRSVGFRNFVTALRWVAEEP